jgi:hypothetical protein
MRRRLELLSISGQDAKHPLANAAGQKLHLIIRGRGHQWYANGDIGLSQFFGWPEVVPV